MKTQDCLKAGTAVANVTPNKSQFLFGYPHVERISIGVHDPLLATALYLTEGDRQALFVAVDVIFLSKSQVCEIRQAVFAQTGVPVQSIMVSATHTHSGPVTVSLMSCNADPIVPPPDPYYIQFLIEQTVAACVRATTNIAPAEMAIVAPNVLGLGTNRHDPQGPSILKVPMLFVRSATDKSLWGVMLTCSMHPTVLHQDSRLVSGDFFGLARQSIQETLGEKFAVLVQMGAAGNQSPRHVIRSNTLSEAKRLGSILAKAIHDALEVAEFSNDWPIVCYQSEIELPRREFPSLDDALAQEKSAAERLDFLRRSSTDKAAIRGAECDWFGAQETVTLARIQDEGKLESAIAGCIPAEIHMISIGRWYWIGWPCEVFVEFAIQIGERFPQTSIVTLANGELQGYLVTQEAIQKKTYEAMNAVFASPTSGEMLVAKTNDMIAKLQAAEQ